MLLGQQKKTLKVHINKMSRDDDRGGTIGASEDNEKQINVQGSQLKPMLEPGVIKAFAAGLIVGNLNKSMMMGFLVGALGGVYIQQNIAGVPNVITAWRDFVDRWKRTGK